MIKVFSFFLVFLIQACASDSYYYEYGKKVYLQPAIQTRGINNNSIKYYKTQNNKTIGIKNEIIIKLKKDANLDSLLQRYDIDKTNTKKISKDMYLIKLTKEQDIFEFAQKLYHDSDTLFATINKIKKYQLR